MTNKAVNPDLEVTGPIVEVTDAKIVVMKGKDRWEIARTADDVLAFDEDHPLAEFGGLDRGARERVTDTHLPHVAELPRVLPECGSSGLASSTNPVARTAATALRP